MELGSGSLTEPGGSSPPNLSTESLNGLKFGQKIYFEDVGSSSSVKTSGQGSTSSTSTSTPTGSGSGSGRKVRSGGGVLQSGQPPRCQVEGCQVDLSDAKAYYSRHKVCSMHSKSPMVIVASLQQRFCQQCSRFHQLPEFDQGKRSCRRRLAGHNERRRKPPPAPLLAARYGRLSSNFENSNRVGGFLVDFSAYPRAANRDPWPATRLSERVPGNQSTVTARPLPHPPWQTYSENPPSDLFVQGSTGGTGFSSPGIPSGECFTGVPDSSCALSLLSNQPWGSSNRASGVSDLMHAQGASMPQPASPHGVAVNQYPNMSWGLKDNEASGSSHQMHPLLGLGSMSQSVNSQFSGGLELSQQRRHYPDVEHSGDYDDSTLQTNWSL